MNNERRLFREIISYYKNMVRASRPADTQSVLRNLPLCLQISCPEGIYDPNVEPDKDDVLFADEKIVQATLQRFIRTTYRITASDLEATQCTPAHANQASLEDLGDMSDHRGTQGAYTRPLKTRAIFSPLSSNRGDFDTIERGGDHLQIYVRPEAKIIDEPPLRHTAIDDGPVGDSSSMVNTLSSEPFSDSISSTQAELNNPWITAKINASIRERPGSPSIRGLHMPMQPALSAANKGPSILSMLQKSRRGPLPTPDPSSSPNGRDLDRLIIPGSTRIHQPGSSSPIPLSSSPPSMLRQPGFGAQVRARYTRSVGMRNPERFSYFEREIIRPESLPSATGCVEEDDHRLARFDSHDINDDEQVETERRTVRTTKLPSFRSRHSAALNTSSHPHSESSPSPSDVQSAGGMEVQANDIGELATRSSHSQLEGRVQLQLAKQQDLQNANIIQILNPNTQGNQSIGISLRYGNAGDPRLTLLGINGHTLGKRRLTRAITATLPLEKVPENQQLQSVVLQVNIAVSAILEANQRVSMAISPPRITETIESSVPSDLEILWQVLHERDELIRCIKRLSSDRIDDTEYVWSEGRTGQAI